MITGISCLGHNLGPSGNMWLIFCVLESPLTPFTSPQTSRFFSAIREKNSQCRDRDSLTRFFSGNTSVTFRIASVVNHVRSKISVSSDRQEIYFDQSFPGGCPRSAGTVPAPGMLSSYRGNLLDVVGSGGKGKWGFQNTKDHRNSPRWA